MEYPAELQFTPVEERAMLGGLQVTVTLEEILEDVEYTYEQFKEDDDNDIYANCKSLTEEIKKSLGLEFERAKGTSILDNLDFEEQITLKRKLENRANMRTAREIQLSELAETKKALEELDKTPRLF
jgi:hypothetical protein